MKIRNENGGEKYFGMENEKRVNKTDEVGVQVELISVENCITIKIFRFPGEVLN